MRLKPIKNLFSIVGKQEYNLKYFQEYLKNQNGELATPEKIEEIKQKRQEFIDFLISEYKTWLFDIEIEKTLQQWQVVIAIQNILMTFDAYILGDEKFKEPSEVLSKFLGTI